MPRIDDLLEHNEWFFVLNLFVFKNTKDAVAFKLMGF
jgi:hypothetical protein